MKSTKRQVENALRRIHPDCELIEQSFGDFYDVEFVAPFQMHWSEGPHALVMSQYADNDKASFWGECLKRLDDACRVVSCGDESNPCEHVAGGADCEFWSEELNEV